VSVTDHTYIEVTIVFKLLARLLKQTFRQMNLKQINVQNEVLTTEIINHSEQNNVLKCSTNTSNKVHF
jgi:hypothetical protein